MKKVFTVLAAFTISAPAFSQVSFGVQGIGNLSKAKIKAEEMVNLHQSSILLPGAGIVAEINFGNNLAIRTGINFLQQGLKLKGEISGDFGEEITSVNFEGKSTLNYLQVPVNFLYNFPAGDNQFYVGAGGYASYGLSGKNKITTTVKMNNGEKEVESDDSDPFEKDGDETGLKRGDFGVNALAGIKFVNGLFVNVGYQLGLSNISGGEEGEYKNRGLQLTLGYFLWKK